MTPNDALSLAERKNTIRRTAYDARSAQPQKDEFSRSICEEFVSLAEYVSAKTVMWYIDVRSEVRTKPNLLDALKTDKRVIIPYCFGDNLRLWWLEDMNELVEGTWKILEPPKARWSEVNKHVHAQDLDIIMVPGVAFDRHGGRVGNGKGYYDKLLENVRSDTALVAVAFESQLFDAVPSGPQDIYMDKVVTEKAVYQGRGR